MRCSAYVTGLQGQRLGALFKLWRKGPCNLYMTGQAIKNLYPSYISQGSLRSFPGSKSRELKSFILFIIVGVD